MHASLRIEAYVKNLIVSATVQLVHLTHVTTSPAQIISLWKLQAEDSRLLVHVNLCGDGAVCPPPGHPQPTAAFYSQRGGNGWIAESTHLATNTVVRLNATSTRGFGSIILDKATNTTATAYYQDWVADSSGRITLITPGKAMAAPVTGLPPMLEHVTPLAFLPMKI
jgi:hypothetical protein